MNGNKDTNAFPQIDSGLIHHGCALAGMADLSPESIDLCVTDPPYRLNQTTGSMTSSTMQDRWGGNIRAADKTAGIQNDITFDAWLPLVYRVLKSDSHLYVFVNDKNVRGILNAAHAAGFRFHNLLVWKKNNCTPNRWYMKNCEFIAFLHKGKSFPINNLGTAQLLEYSNISGRAKNHPVEKPVDLLRVLIENSSRPGDLILDPFAGGGSTAVAARRSGRRFIGFEIDEQHYRTALSSLEKIA